MLTNMSCPLENETTISLNYDYFAITSNMSKYDDGPMNNKTFKIGLIVCYVMIFLVTFIGKT